MDANKWVMVPKSALDWLLGEGDEFECPPDKYFKGKPAPYWWRGVFKAMISAAPQPPATPKENDMRFCPKCGGVLTLPTAPQSNMKGEE